MLGFVCYFEDVYLVLQALEWNHELEIGHFTGYLMWMFEAANLLEVCCLIFTFHANY